MLKLRSRVKDFAVRREAVASSSSSRRERQAKKLLLRGESFVIGGLARRCNRGSLYRANLSVAEGRALLSGPHSLSERCETTRRTLLQSNTRHARIRPHTTTTITTTTMLRTHESLRYSLERAGLWLVRCCCWWPLRPLFSTVVSVAPPPKSLAVHAAAPLWRRRAAACIAFWGNSRLATWLGGHPFAVLQLQPLHSHDTNKRDIANRRPGCQETVFVGTWLPLAPLWSWFFTAGSVDVV